MPSVRLVLTVPEHIHANFVTPKKLQKSLNKTLLSLMEGYLNDDYIRAYVEGDLGHVAEDIVSSMREDLQNAFPKTDEAISFGSALAGAGVEVFEQGLKHQEKQEENLKELGLVTAEEFNDKMSEMTALMEQMKEALESRAMGVSPVVAPVAVPSAVQGGGAVGVGEENKGLGDAREIETVESTFIEETPTNAVVDDVIEETPAVAPESVEKTEEERAKELEELSGFGFGFNMGGL